METQEEIINKKVGTKETPKLEAKPVKIVSVEVQTETKEGVKMKSALIHFKVKHPEKEELISIAKAKVNKDDKLLVTGLWSQVDEDNNFQKGSAVAAVLKHLGCECIADTYGKEIETVTESETSKFLCLKAY